MDVLVVDYRATDAAEKFALSLKETGFAVLKNHPVSWDKVEKIYQEWFAFFNNPAKFNYQISNDNQEGYVPLTIAEKAKGASVKDLKEFFQLYFPSNRYPAEVSALSREYFDEVFQLGKALCQWLQEYMPVAVSKKLSEPIPDMLSSERTQLRVLHYPGLRGNEEAGAIRAAAHEDINLITILPSATEPGLQVMGTDGKWRDVPTDPGTLVVNIGDMLQEATGHFYKSTSHRVLNPEGADMTKPRLSLPMFIHPKAETRLSDHYPTAEAYLDERLRELGLRQ